MSVATCEILNFRNQLSELQADSTTQALMFEAQHKRDCALVSLSIISTRRIAFAVSLPT